MTFQFFLVILELNFKNISDYCYNDESKVLEYFDNVRLNSPTLDIFTEVVKVTNYTELWDAELSWYSLTATLWIFLFNIQSQNSHKVLVIQTKFLERSGYCIAFLSFTQQMFCWEREIKLKHTLSARLRIFWLCPLCRGERTPSKQCSWHDTKLHLMVKLQFWRSGECGIPLHYHYSQVHSDSE